MNNRNNFFRDLFFAAAAGFLIGRAIRILLDRHARRQTATQSHRRPLKRIN
jgi:hypothetical protein